MLLVIKGIDGIRFHDPIVSGILNTCITDYLHPDHPSRRKLVVTADSGITDS
jgi:hypothetical protein